MRVKLPAGIAALAAAALLAGCGGDVVSLDPVAQAATTTSQAQSFRFTFHGSAGSSGVVDGSGAYDADGKRLRMRLTVPFGTGAPVHMDLVSVGTDAYVRVPLLAAFLPQGKSWIAFDLAKAAKETGVDAQQVLQASQTSPAELLSALVHSDKSVSVGAETLGGVHTTHYRTTLDSLAHVSAAPVPVDVWVGDDDLVRRLQVSAAAAGFTEDLSGYGDPVSVDVPSAAETVDSAAVKR